MSASKVLEPGFRTMLLLGAELFRLDVVVRGDTLQTVVRPLCPGELTMSGPGAAAGEHVTVGEAADYRPGHSRLDFTLGSGADRLTVEVTLATLQFSDRGTARVSAQAIVRQAPVR